VLGGVSETDHALVARQKRAHRLALHADPLAVDDANRREAGGDSVVEVGQDDFALVLRREAVKIEYVLERKLDHGRVVEIRLLELRSFAFGTRCAPFVPFVPIVPIVPLARRAQLNSFRKTR
jgi:hypothetical protein